MDDVFRAAAEPLKEIAFFKYGLPLILMAGMSAFFYYGFTGIVRKHTIGLSKPPGSGSRPLVITGNMARVAGVIYVICGVLGAAASGLTMFYIWF